jgi:uncharacterized membrane protein YdbT with pleckstrin-like domain
LAVHRLRTLPNEEVLVDVRPHWSYLSAPLAVAVVVIAIGIALDVGIPHTSVALHWVEGAVVAVPCLWLAVRGARWWRTGLFVTTLRLVGHWGVLVEHEWELRLCDIEAVTVVRSAFRRLAGTGRLELTLVADEADEADGEEDVRVLDDVRKPEVLARILARRIGPPDLQEGGGR